LKRAKSFANEYGIDPSELWLVIDVDNWGEQQLDVVCHECQRLGFHVAVSNPCFELWLVFHQEKPKTPPIIDACIHELKRILGQYTKAEYDVSKLLPHIEIAIKHARHLDRDSIQAWPHETGTHVYRLVEQLMQPRP
jgi:hypothetical protein